MRLCLAIGLSLTIASVSGAGVQERLVEAEAVPVLADPVELTRILETCREDGDTDCIARALLVRAELFDQGGRLFPEVEADAMEAVRRLTPAGPSPALAGALLLAAGNDPDKLGVAIEVAAASEAHSVKGRAFCRLAGNAIQARDFQRVGEELQKARRHLEDGDLPRVQACSGYYEGLALHNQWKPVEARDVWIDLIETLDDPRASREMLWVRIGASAVSINPLIDIPAALEHGRAAVDLADRLHGEFDASKAYVNLTSALRSAGRYAEVEAVGVKALELSRKSGSPAAELIVQRCLGEAAAHRGDLPAGLLQIEESTAIARRLGDRFNLMLSLTSAGSVSRRLGRPDKAATLLNEAQSIADQFGFPFWRSTVLSQRANLELSRGDLSTASHLAQEALDMLGPRDLEPTAWALDARSRIRQLEGNLDDALDDLRRTNELFQELDLIGPQATTNLEIGNIYYRLFRMDRAIAYYRRASSLAEEAGTAPALERARTNLSLIDWRHGKLEDHREAILAEAGRLSETTDPRRINQMLNLSEAALLLNATATADRLIAATERILAASGTNPFAADMYRLRAKVLSQQGNDAQAVETCRQALDHAGADFRSVFLIRWACGLVHEAAGDLEGALGILRSAESTAWTIRESTDRPELRVTLLADQTGFYSDLVRVMLAINKKVDTAVPFDDLLAASDRFRSWNLLDAMARDRDESIPSGSENRTRLLNRMAHLQLEATTAPESGYADLLEHIRIVEERLAELSPGTPVRDLLGRRHASTDDLQAAIPPGTVLLEYLLGYRTSFVLAIGKDKVHIAALETTAREVRQDVLLFRSLLRRQPAAEAGSREAARIVGTRLYRSLLAPVEIMLEGIDSLIICPDLSLNELPFEALVTPQDDYLVEHFQVATVPSFAFFLELRNRERQPAAGPALVALADPVPAEGIVPVALEALPFSRQEARIAVRRSGGGSRAILGSAATEHAARQALQSGACIVHFATHGFLDPQSIGRSGILLTPDVESGDDGLLQAREVIYLDLTPDIVVLSGCKTGGRSLGGEGLIGLPHALFQAGAPSVIMSLWEVRDGAAAVFMDRFYGRLSEGLDVGAALKAAKLDLLHSGRDDLSHPSTWSPFVLAGIGDHAIELPGQSPSRMLLFGGLLALAVLLWVLGWWWRSRMAAVRED